MAVMPSEVSREKFFRAALDVCAEKGYHAMRIDEVVARAGGSKGGFYHHFKSKRELFLQLFQRTVGGVQRSLAALLNPNASAADVLRSTFRAFGELMSDKALMRSMIEFYVVGLHDDVVRDNFVRFYQETLAFGLLIVRTGIERGEFDPSLDPESVARALFPGADGIVIIHLAMGQVERASDVLPSYLELMLRGMANKPSPRKRTGL
jgi:AcrR family transcriptional regulator